MSKRAQFTEERVANWLARVALGAGLFATGGACREFERDALAVEFEQGQCAVCRRRDAASCHSDSPSIENSCFRFVATYEGSRDLVISVAWSPVDDYVLSGANGEVRLLHFDEAAQTLTSSDVYSQQGGRAFVAWSPDGLFALSASKDIRLLAIARERGTITENARYNGHRGDIYAVAWSNDGKFALSAGQDGTARLLAVDVAAGTLEERARFVGHAGKIFSLFLSHDGKYVALAVEDGTLRLVSVAAERGELREVSRVAFSEQVTSVAWSPNETALILGTWGQCNAAQLLLADVEVRALRLQDTSTGHSSGIRTARFTPNGDYAVTAGHDDTVRFYRVPPAPHALELVAALPDNRLGVHDVSFSRDGSRMLVAASHMDRLTLVDTSDCAFD